MNHTTRPSPRPALRFLPAVAWMGVIFTFSSRHHIAQPPGVHFDLSMLGHFTVYFILAALLWWALPGRLSSRRRIILAFVIAVLYGASDEWHQSFVPGRHPDVTDLVVDAIGSACGLWFAAWLAHRWPELPIWPQATRSEPPEYA